MSDPWQVKFQIDKAHEMAARNGFKLVNDRDVIALETAGHNEHGFADDTRVERFEDWRDVILFFSGWEKLAFAQRQVHK